MVGHFHLVLMFRMHGAILPLTQYIFIVWHLIKHRYIFMAWDLVKHRDDFTLLYFT
jgi:hypothetical protein